MKKKLSLVILLAVFLLPAISQISIATEPDTIWTIGAKQECWFSPDGMKILVRTHKCLNVSDGSVVWDSTHIIPNGYFSQDSLYFYDRDFAKFRISDGVKVSDKPSFYFDTVPDFFRDSSRIWSKPEKDYDEYMLPDENIFFYLYSQDYLSLYGERLATQSLICKYDKSLDSIVKYVPLVKGTDTLIKGSAEIIGYVSPNNTILVKFDDDTTYRQYSVTNLDSASQFIYDRENNGWVEEHKISYNGKYLGMGTNGFPGNLGWIIIYDLTNNSIYNKFLNGDSTTSDGIELIAFSRNDSCLATYGYPMRTWNFHTATLIHSYDEDYWAQWSLDVSPDNTKIIAPSAERTYLLRARWTPVTSVEEESEAPELMLVYPNPGTDEVRIEIPPLERGSGGVAPVVRVFNVLGIEHPATLWHPSKEGNLRIDVSSLSPGVYFVQVGDKVSKFVKM